ncbi:MAG: hypothetical protein KDB11_33505 [Planctomycetales bacterium]|nr:hypothetical protein [Planctomycetales bacterium]
MKNMICSHTLGLMITLGTLSGCDTPDERLVRDLAETSREVVQQQQEIAKSHSELAEGSKRLVNAVADSRHEHQELQQTLQQQSDKLDAERRAIASSRQRESLLVPVLETMGVLLVASLPLILCWYLLHSLRDQADDISERLVSELVNQMPKLVAGNRGLQGIERSEPQADRIEPPF